MSKKFQNTTPKEEIVEKLYNTLVSLGELAKQGKFTRKKRFILVSRSENEIQVSVDFKDRKKPVILTGKRNFSTQKLKPNWKISSIQHLFSQKLIKKCLEYSGGYDDINKLYEMMHEKITAMIPQLLEQAAKEMKKREKQAVAA